MAFTLRVKRGLLGVEFELEQEGHTLLTDSVKLTEPEKLDGLLSDLSTGMYPSFWGDPRAQLSGLSRPLARILPERLREALRVGGTLHIETEDRTLPWELAELTDGQTLGQSMDVTRRFQQPARAAAAGGTRRALLVADCQGVLPWTAVEARQIGQILKSACIPELLTLEKADSMALTASLNSGELALLHLAVNILPNGELLLADRALSDEDLHELVLGRAPEVVILCLYATAPPRPERPFLEPLAGWARQLTSLGVRSVLGWLWEIGHPEQFLYPFYTRLSQGIPIGEAVRETRAQESDAWLTPHTFVLFGDPTTRLTAPPQARVAPAATVDSRFQPLYRLSVQAGPEEGRKILLFPQSLEEGQVITLGSPGLKPNEIELDDPEIPNRAATLELREDGLRITNSSSSPLRVNGLHVREVFLFGGETIELGETRLLFERASDQARQGERDILEGRYFLQVVKGGAADTGKLFPLRQGVSVLGRLEDCAVQLNDPAVSRQHLYFTLHDRVTVTPLSANPSAVNGVELERERELKHSDVLQLTETTVLKFIDGRQR